MDKVPESELKARLVALRVLMRKDKASAAVVTTPAGVHYYSGFTGVTQHSTDAYLLITKKEQFLVSDSRYTEEAGKSSPLCEFVLWRKHPAESISKILARKRAAKIFYEESSITQSFFSKMAGNYRKGKFIAASGIINKPRRKKSSFEVKLIKKALRIAEKSFLELLKTIKPGMLETDIALDLEYKMRKNGSSGIAFPTIVAINANSSLPHAHPGKRKVKKGALLLIDWGACYRFYNSDLTRTVFIDSMPKLWQNRYLCVLNAQKKALRNIRSGVTGSEVDAHARNLLSESGLDKYFTHSLGHGVGIEVHELPVLSKRNEVPLDKGEIVTVEPGIYFPGSGGIRIEDMVLIKDGSREILSRLPKGLDWSVV